MTATTDTAGSAAGADQGHQAFQEFLLAGERNVVSGLKRPGAEQWFADFYSASPQAVQTTMSGYFQRQSRLDLSQRVAILGDYTKLKISEPLNPQSRRTVRRLNPAIRAELDILTSRAFVQGSDRFSVITTIDDAVAQEFGRLPGPAQLPAKPVQYVDLLGVSVEVEKSQDDTWLTRATDTVHFAVTTIAEDGKVGTKLTKHGSISEGHKQDLKGVVLGTVKLSAASKTYPRTLSFKIDAVEKDEGRYKEVLDASQKYLQELVTEQLIAAGIIVAGKWVGIPVPPILANFIASYVKAWFDDAVDWLIGLIGGDDEDDLLGSYTALITLSDAEFEFSRRNLFTNRTDEIKGSSPLKGFTFVRVFSGEGGRWRVVFQWQLR